MSDYAVILAARNSSTRLPNKAIVSYCTDGTPNLTQIIRRWQGSRRQPAIIVVTSDAAEDDSIADLAARSIIPCYRAPYELVQQRDVIAQIDSALKQFAPDAKHIARALCDNPLVDVALSDWRYDVLCETRADGLYYGGDESRITYAGTTDIYSREAWDRMMQLSKGEEREHPGAHFWSNISRYSAVQLPLPPREYLAPVRTELDTPEDLQLFKAVFSAWGDAIIPTLWALDWIMAHPDIAALNAHIQAKTQSKVSFGRGSAFLCKSCQRRTGTVDAGNFTFHCRRCGKPQKFYQSPRTKPSQMHY